MLEDIKKLREETGAGVVDVKKALDEADGDMDVARDLLRKRGQAKALKKAGRETNEGFIGSYVHSNGKMAAMVKLLCETDFVARNDTFRELAKDIAMHIVASNPRVVSAEDVPEDAVEKERVIWREQLATEGKPAELVEKIIAGKEKKFREESALLSQPFVKNPEQTVGDVITDAIAKTGEKITVEEFVRFEL